MAKILQKFKVAAIVDAFSGPGIYKQGDPGSPIVIARSYLEHRHLPRFGHLRILCCEKRQDRVDRLNLEIQKLPPSPGLSFDVRPPGDFESIADDLVERSHLDGPGTPVLWIIDPFDIKSVGMDTIRKCLANRRDELILTFFVNEMHRLAEKNPNMAPALDRHFGDNSWRSALPMTTESNRKEAFSTLFDAALRKDRSLRSGRLGIRVSNHTSRYDLVFATHSDSGLECWNNMAWRVDRVSGRGMSIESAQEPDLFGEPVTARLYDAIAGLAGTETSWNALVSLALRLNFKETHLRQVLDSLNRAGLAIRTEPLLSKSDWPTDCKVRIYDQEDLADN
jgi:three-Cys-motif partner protein